MADISFDDVCGYYGMAAKHAIKIEGGKWKAKALSALTIAIIVSGVLVYLAGFEYVVEKRGLALGCLAIELITLAAVFYGWSFISSPAVLHQEQEQELQKWRDADRPIEIGEVKKHAKALCDWLRTPGRTVEDPEDLKCKISQLFHELGLGIEFGPHDFNQPTMTETMEYMAQNLQNMTEYLMPDGFNPNFKPRQWLLELKQFK